MFKALYLDRQNGFSVGLRELDESALPPGEVTLAVSHSTLNYKDALALTNKSPVVRLWPMVPGIDGAGVVLHSSDPRWREGDAVILNGWGVGETHWGCLAQRARLKADWLVALPQGMTARQAMAIGTAGYTAMLCVMALQEQGVAPAHGEILVTGATGGVGSIAVALLARRGYTVVAATGKLNDAPYLKNLGAAEVLDRATLSAPGKPLQKERWAGVVDAVGSHTLANALAQTRYGGVVAACGLAQGMDLSATVMPFILRGVRLIGVDSVMAPLARRQQAWSLLAQELDASLLDAMVTEIGLADCEAQAQAIMAGKVRGRLVVDLAR
ncbi:MAG: MDR family oxidoreductase [Rhodoferax sp.]